MRYRVSPLLLALSAALLLSGCAWSLPAALGVALLLSALAMGCERAMGTDHDAALDGSTPDAAVVDARAPDAGADAGASVCGGGHCPDRMTCVEQPGGPWCLPDVDQDGLPDDADNCPFTANPDQIDTDGNHIGDACDVCDGDPTPEKCGDPCCMDPDGDGVPGDDLWMGGLAEFDNCPYLWNPDQTDTDGDGIGDACDLCPETPDVLSPCGPICLDSDGDGVADFGHCSGTETDGCALSPTTALGDVDGDGEPDGCDPDGVAPLPGSAGKPHASRIELLRHYRAAGILDDETVRIAMIPTSRFTST
jgi:hypothetical protein